MNNPYDRYLTNVDAFSGMGCAVKKSWQKEFKDKYAI